MVADGNNRTNKKKKKPFIGMSVSVLKVYFTPDRDRHSEFVLTNIFKKSINQQKAWRKATRLQRNLP